MKYNLKIRIKQTIFMFSLTFAFLVILNSSEPFMSICPFVGMRSVSIAIGYFLAKILVDNKISGNWKSIFANVIIIISASFFITFIFYNLSARLTIVQITANIMYPFTAALIIFNTKRELPLE